MARDRDRKSAAGERRRAGGYLAQLGWLEGYPDEDGWRRAEDDVLIPLDGAMVAKARRTARTVIREHADALPKLVGDVDRWWAIVDAKLAWMSGAIAGKPGAFDPLPHLTPRLAQTIRDLARTPVGPAARAAAIAYAGRTELDALIEWLAEHRALALESGELPGWRVVLALARLAMLGDAGKARGVRERAVDALIALCEVDAPDGFAALQASRNIENRLRHQESTKKPALDATRSPSRVMPWIVGLSTRAPVERQRILALVAEAQLAEALAPWQAWERQHATLLARAAALAQSKFESAVDRAAHEVKVVIKIEKSRAQAPVDVSIKDALLELGMLGDDHFARMQPSMVRLLSAMPAALDVAARTRMLLHLARAAATKDENEHPEWVWDALATALADGAPLELLAPWRSTLTSDGRLYIESDLLEHAPRRSDVERIIRVLVLLAWQGTIGKEDPTRAAIWLAAGLTDETMVAEITAALRAVDGWMLPDTARTALALADHNVADLTAIAKLLLETAETWRHSTTEALCALLEHSAASGGAWIVRAALEATQAAALATIGETLKLMPRARWPALCHEPKTTAWIDRYPVALHPALHRLASVDPDAERTAAKRLATDVPDPAALRQEIAALRERLDKAGAAKRLANLEARLRSPKPPSPARLATLATKLERAAREIGLARFIHAITTGASERVIKAFGLPGLPAWAEPPKTIALLFAMLALDATDRELAGRMIRARLGDRPWDLRDEPANQTFLEEVRRSGIDPAPWLDDTVHVFKDQAGEPFTLAMTDDPIEVFAMGAHFETCLSPDGGNFFSVVANAADVNKRVIYAKRDGRVIGRCLIALTDGFAILIFHVYCHENIQLEAHVRDFVLELAGKMGTTVVPRGTVRLLLARDWYDDGPRDLVGRFRGLDDAGLDFDAIEPAQLVGVLRAALDRELDDVTLPIILGHAGLSRRPELVIPLAPYVLASAAPQTHIAAAELALRAGDRALADRLLGDHAATIRIDDHPWHYGQLLAELRPSYTLARLRETRHRDIRTWEDERGDRVAVAGVALAALHRPKQAAAMFRLAMKHEDWLAPFMKVRLEALGESVDDTDDD